MFPARSTCSSWNAWFACMYWGTSTILRPRTGWRVRSIAARSADRDSSGSLPDRQLGRVQLERRARLEDLVHHRDGQRPHDVTAALAEHEPFGHESRQRVVDGAP